MVSITEFAPRASNANVDVKVDVKGDVGASNGAGNAAQVTRDDISSVHGLAKKIDQVRQWLIEIID